MAVGKTFDPKAKGNEKIASFVANNRALVFDTQPTNRTTIRRVLTQFGFKPNQVDVAESLDSAIVLFHKYGHKLVVSEYAEAQAVGFTLYQEVKERYPNRTDSAFLLTAEKETNLLLNRCEDDYIDGVVIRPFTLTNLADGIEDILRKKALPSDYDRFIGDARVFLKQGKYKEAFYFFEKSKPLHPKPVDAWIGSGQALRRMRSTQAAFSCFQAATQLDPSNFWALSGLFELLIDLRQMPQAEASLNRILKEHRFRPRRLPEYIRFSVCVGKFEQMPMYYEMFAQLEEVEDSIVNSISAGLLLGAKHFLKEGNKDLGTSCLKKALLACRGKASFLIDIVVSLITEGLMEEVVNILKMAPKEVKDSPEVRLAEFEQVEAAGNPSRVVEMAMELIRAGIRNRRVYELIIKRSLDLKRRKEVIQEIVDEACRLYPHDAKYFKHLASAS